MTETQAPRGAFIQRDKETYAVVPRIGTAGMVDPAVLRRLADTAEQFGIPIIKLIGAQRFALVGLKPDQVEAVWAALGMEPAPAVGPCVHYVTACPGNVVCRFGQQNALALAEVLDKGFLGAKDLPAKFKIGISGCPFCCCESWLRDFGAFGKLKGWTVIVGGRAGARPRIGDKIAENVPSEDILGLLEKTLQAYRELGKKGERLGTTIDRVGLDVFRTTAGI